MIQIGAIGLGRAGPDDLVAYPHTPRTGSDTYQRTTAFDLGWEASIAPGASSGEGRLTFILTVVTIEHVFPVLTSLSRPHY
jgi:hypothetical protein